MKQPAGGREGGVALLGLVMSFWLLAACTDAKGDSGGDTGDTGSSVDTDSGTHDSGNSGGTDSGDTSTAHGDEAALVTTLEIGVEGLYAESLEGGAQPIGGPYDAGGVSITYVEPGSWWVTAYSPDFAACNRSDTVVLAAGDRLAWTVSEMPGTFDADGYCVIP